MVYELEDTSKAASLFEGWSETLITSCLQKGMGKIYVTDTAQLAFCQKSDALRDQEGYAVRY